MRYKVYISQVWTYTTEVEADSRADADALAGDIANNMTPMDSPMKFGDEYVEVEMVKETKK